MSPCLLTASAPETARRVVCYYGVYGNWAEDVDSRMPISMDIAPADPAVIAMSPRDFGIFTGQLAPIDDRVLGHAGNQVGGHAQAHEAAGGTPHQTRGGAPPGDYHGAAGPAPQGHQVAQGEEGPREVVPLGDRPDQERVARMRHERACVSRAFRGLDEIQGVHAAAEVRERERIAALGRKLKAQERPTPQGGDR